MLGSLSLSLLGFFLVGWSTAQTTSTQCISEKATSHYKPIASWRSVNKGFNTTNETECEALCCLSNYTMYIFSANLSLYDNSNCLLLLCQNKSLCWSRLQDEDENSSSAIVFLGIKGTGNITDAIRPSKSTKHNQFIHSPLISTSYHGSLSNRSTNVSLVKPSPFTVQKSLNKTRINSTQTNNQTSEYNNTNHSLFLAPLDKNATLTFSINHMHSSQQTLKSIMDHLVTPNVSHNATAIHSKPKVSFNATTPHTNPSVSPTTIPVPLMDAKSNESPFVPTTMVTIFNHTISSLVEISDSILHVVTTSSSGGSVKTYVHTKIPTSSRILENKNISRSVASSSIRVVHTPSSKKKFAENHNHTTPASLVISLIIGILFFGAVVFLIGRRWAETCLRRSYSRVDYLLNDYE